jgi:hypothetical protein
MFTLSFWGAFCKGPFKGPYSALRALPAFCLAEFRGPADSSGHNRTLWDTTGHYGGHGEDLGRTLLLVEYCFLLLLVE